jgi:hypothetical protein
VEHDIGVTGRQGLLLRSGARESFGSPQGLRYWHRRTARTATPPVARRPALRPRKALTPGGNGLKALCKISQLARDILVDGGWLMFEHGFEQVPASREIMQQAGFENIKTLDDLQNHERITIAEKSGN